MIRSWISSSRLATIRSTRLKTFETTRSMLRNQQDSYQSSTTWFCGKAILKKRILGSLHWQFNTFKGSSPPITRITQRSRQQHPSPSIQPYQWLDPPLHQWQGSWQFQQKNVVNLLRPLPLLSSSKQKSLRPLFCLILSGFPPPSPTRVKRFFTKYT